MPGTLFRGRTRRLASGLMALPLLALGACATLVPRLEAPSVEVVAMELAGGGLDQQQIHLQLRVSNPNDRAIAVRGIECQLALAGSDFAQGSSDAPFTLPPLGVTDVGLSVTADMAGALLALAANLGGRIDYRLYGQVHLAGGLIRTIPFDQQGRVRLH